MGSSVAVAVAAAVEHHFGKTVRTKGTAAAATVQLGSGRDSGESPFAEGTDCVGH